MALSLTGCASGITISGRTDIATGIAQDGQLNRHDLHASPFILASWQRITDPSAPVNLYIEGDGAAWLNRTTPSKNPTPKNPVALKLAATDNSPNVVYIARPCQYTDISASGNACRDYYWRGGRFAPEIVQSLDTALNQITTQTNQSGFHLIGFSGGANIAGLLAERRTDIITIRTVSGNIDNDFFVTLHDVSQMPASLNMADYAMKISHIPQMHFVGADDKITPPSLFKSYQQKSKFAPCVQSKIMNGFSHEDGWNENWPHLLALPVTCPASHE